jgi:predicted acylesterase/phospholipase RssA
MRACCRRPGAATTSAACAPLVLVATDLDSGATAPFGQPGWDHVPISQAVAASAALPGLFPPVPIDGRWYVDGALKKTLHARVLLDMGLDLVLCLNPLVPFASPAAGIATGCWAARDGASRTWSTAACRWC